MEENYFDMLKAHYFHKKTFEEIGQQYGCTRQRVKQILENLINKFIPEKYLQDWKAKNDLSGIESDDLLTVIFLVGYRDRNKITRVIQDLGIKKPEDFLRYSRKDLIDVRNMSPRLYLRLRIALFKFGLKYGKENLEEVENELSKIEAKDKTNGGLSLRFKILERDKFTCQYCGRNPRDNESIILNVDHIRPISADGTWEENNLITACFECNLGKRDKILENRPSKSI